LVDFMLAASFVNLSVYLCYLPVHLTDCRRSKVHTVSRGTIATDLAPWNLKRRARRLLAFAGLALPLAVVLVGCASRPMGPAQAGTEAAAQELLRKSQAAHGGAAFTQLQDVAVEFDGRWYFLITRIQPVVTDIAYRQTSSERILLPSGDMAQTYRGAAGTKHVSLVNGRVAVAYNGVVSTDAAVLESAHMVAEAYKFFLMPAFYVQRAQRLALAQGELVAGQPTVALTGVLRPGFGASAEDRFVLFLDPSTHRVRRVRMTLEGTKSTRGASVDVTFTGYVQRHGLLWPKGFDEEMANPFPGLSAHDFWLTGLDVNRGLKAQDLLAPTGAGMTAPAQSLP
jgi:hypothetical protein